MSESIFVQLPKHQQQQPPALSSSPVFANLPMSPPGDDLSASLKSRNFASPSALAHSSKLANNFAHIRSTQPKDTGIIGSFAQSLTPSAADDKDKDKKRGERAETPAGGSAGGLGSGVTSMTASPKVTNPAGSSGLSLGGNRNVKPSLLDARGTRVSSISHVSQDLNRLASAPSTPRGSFRAPLLPLQQRQSTQQQQQQQPHPPSFSSSSSVIKNSLKQLQKMDERSGSVSSITSISSRKTLAKPSLNFVRTVDSPRHSYRKLSQLKDRAAKEHIGKQANFFKAKLSETATLTFSSDSSTGSRLYTEGDEDDNDEDEDGEGTDCDENEAGYKDTFYVQGQFCKAMSSIDLKALVSPRDNHGQTPKSSKRLFFGTKVPLK